MTVTRLQQLEAIAVVAIGDLFPLKTLLLVELLLLFERVDDKVLLQLLVGIVDAKLREPGARGAL